MTTSEALAIGLHHLRADADSPYARAVLAELHRLYEIAGERPPSPLEHACYVQTQRNEILRETYPRLNADDGPDALEDA
jgi:hypothetical protein